MKLFHKHFSLVITFVILIVAIGFSLFFRRVDSARSAESVDNVYPIVKAYCKVQTDVCKEIAHTVLDPILIGANVDPELVDKAIDLWLKSPI